jgi:hypothetical protein
MSIVINVQIVSDTVIIAIVVLNKTEQAMR